MGSWTQTVSFNASAPDVALASNLTAGVFGSSVINLQNATYARMLMLPGSTNWTENTAFAILARIVPNWTGNPAGTQVVLQVQACDISGNRVKNGIFLWINTSGQLFVQLQDRYGTVIFNANTSSACGFVAGTPIDLMFSCDGLTTAGAAQMSVNGTAVAMSSNTLTGIRQASLPHLAGTMFCGSADTATVCNYDLNELVIWNNNQSVTTPLGRSGFISTTAFDGLADADPGPANVRSGIAYTINGVSETGTLDLPATTNVRAGTTYDGGTKTGLMDLPGVANVLSGVTFDDSTKTGTLDIGGSVWGAALSSYTDKTKFGGFIQTLLSLAKFLGLK